MGDGEFILLTDLLGILVCGIVAFIDMKSFEREKEEKRKDISCKLFTIQMALKDIQIYKKPFTYLQIPTDGSYNENMKMIMKDFIKEAFKNSCEYNEVNVTIEKINRKDEISEDDIKELCYIVKLGQSNLSIF